MSNTIKVEIPKELAELLGEDSLTIEQKNLESLVMMLYAEGKITMSKSSNLLNIQVDQFDQMFRERGFRRKGSPETIEEAEQDLENARNL